MKTAAELVAMGYGGYAGWGDPQAGYDFAATGGQGKYTGGGGGGGGESFEFDYEGEVEKAYGELGKYYTELLDEAKGDLNLALARLQEDYETGKRFRMEDYQLSMEGVGLSREALDYARQKFAMDAEDAFREQKNIQLQRGITRASMYNAPGLGIADTERARLRNRINLGQADLGLREKEIGLNQRQLETGLEQANRNADVSLQRYQQDLPEEQRRYERDLEDERRRGAGEMALSREQRAYQRFEANLI